MKIVCVLHSFNINGVLKQNLVLLDLLRRKMEDMRLVVCAPDEGAGRSLYAERGIHTVIFRDVDDLRGKLADVDVQPDVILFESLFSLDDGMEVFGLNAIGVVRVHERLPYKANTRLWARDSRDIRYYFEKFSKFHFVYVCEGLVDYYRDMMYLYNIEYDVGYGMINENEVRDGSLMTDEDENDGFNILQLGTVYPRKGAIETLEAFRVFQERLAEDEKKGTRLLFVGARRSSQREVEYECRLGELIEAYGFHEQVQVLETRANPYPLISSCSMLTMHSFSEAYPTVILEALFMGKPVVATDVGCVGELVQHGKNGYLFEPGDIYMQAEYFLRIFRGEDVVKAARASYLEIRARRNMCQVLIDLMQDRGFETHPA